MTQEGIAAPKANSQAYPVDVMLPLRLLSPSWVLGCAEERPLPSHKQRSFFFALEDEASKKGPRCLPNLGPRITHCERLGPVALRDP